MEREGPCLVDSNTSSPSDDCSQRFEYRWDEVNRLVRARRWDTAQNLGDFSSGAFPTGLPAADLRNLYDAGDQRVLKEAVDSAGEKSYAVYLFETLELRGAQYGEEFDVGTVADVSDYEVTEWTAVPYLLANGVRLARIAYENAGSPTLQSSAIPTDPSEPGAVLASPQLHVFFELGDHLGSTSVVLDKATGELVERSTFQGYGATESDYRPERWKGFREDYKFTGKEEDVEVGLQYFGFRFLNPLLGRWVSPDPLAIHGPGEADFNLYAYVGGGVLQNVDPLGLESKNVSVDADGLTNIRVGNAPAGVAPGERFLPKPAGAGGVASHEQFVKEAKAQGGVVFVYAPGDGMDITAAKTIAEIKAWAVANGGGGESSSGEGGTCSGPACGTAQKGEKGLSGPTDATDLGAQVVGFATGDGIGEEGGQKDGTPGGRCKTCKGSDAQQVAIVGVKAAMAAEGAVASAAKKATSIAKRGATESGGAYLNLRDPLRKRENSIELGDFVRGVVG